MKGLSRKITAFGSFMVELLVYAGFVSAYFFLVLHFLGPRIKPIFDNNKEIYAILAVALISVQGVVLERVTTLLLRFIRLIQAAIQLLHRLERPVESIIRPPEVPGLLVYRFASPLFSFNADYFARRVQELIDIADPPVTCFLINAEAIVDMDMTAAEVLEQLHSTLKRKNIILALCGVKGNFRKALMSLGLPRRAGFEVYPSVAATVKALTEKPPKEEKKSEAAAGPVPKS